MFVILIINDVIYSFALIIIYILLLYETIILQRLSTNNNKPEHARPQGIMGTMTTQKCRSDDLHYIRMQTVNRRLHVRCYSTRLQRVQFPLLSICPCLPVTAVRVSPHDVFHYEKR